MLATEQRLSDFFKTVFNWMAITKKRDVFFGPFINCIYNLIEIQQDLTFVLRQDHATVFESCAIGNVFGPQCTFISSDKRKSHIQIRGHGNVIKVISFSLNASPAKKNQRYKEERGKQSFKVTC